MWCDNPVCGSGDRSHRFAIQAKPGGSRWREKTATKCSSPTPETPNNTRTPGRGMDPSGSRPAPATRSTTARQRREIPPPMKARNAPKSSEFPARVKSRAPAHRPMPTNPPTTRCNSACPGSWRSNWRIIAGGQHAPTAPSQNSTRAGAAWSQSTRHPTVARVSAIYQCR